MMASAQVVETSVNINNSPSQDYTTNPDDHSNHNIDSPGFKPFTVKNIIYCITCTLCNKLYIGESGRKLGDRFREHLLDVKNKGSDLSKPVARHFNLPGHSHENMEICGINLHFGNNETRKRKEQRLIFKLGTLAPNGINERFSFA